MQNWPKLSDCMIQSKQTFFLMRHLTEERKRIPHYRKPKKDVSPARQWKRMPHDKMRQREHMSCQGAHLIIWDKGRGMSHQKQNKGMYHHMKQRKIMSQTFVLKWMSHQTHEVYYLRQRKRMSHHTRQRKKLSQSVVLKRMSHHTTVSTIWDRGTGCLITQDRGKGCLTI